MGGPGPTQVDGQCEQTSLAITVWLCTQPQKCRNASDVHIYAISCVCPAEDAVLSPQPHVTLPLSSFDAILVMFTLNWHYLFLADEE